MHKLVFLNEFSWQYTYITTLFHCPPRTILYEQVYQGLQRVFSDYKDAKRGPTFLFIQTPMEAQAMRSTLGATEDFPSVFIPSLDR